jgi:hypothetical protein
MSQIKFFGPDESNKPTVELSGHDGNVYMIIGRCREAARRADPKWTQEQIKDLSAEMMSGDYDHALQTAMANFEVD